MSEAQLNRVRNICFAFPETTERLSHGAPTQFQQMETSKQP